MDNSRDAEFEIRKQAIKDFLHSGLTQKDIYEKLNKSRYWFEYWFGQYRDNGLAGLYANSKGYPKGKPRKYPLRLTSEIINIRRHLEENSQEYYYGAEKITQELLDLGYNKDEIPSTPYIKKVLSKQGCIRQTKNKNWTPLKGYPEAFLRSLGLLCQMDFVGFKRIHNSNYPIHFLALAYRELKYGNIWRIKAERSSVIMPLLFEYWQDNPKPSVVQMDNDWAFAGSGSAKGTISQMLRFLLALEITPLFIPEASPWRNGSVEGSNSIFGRKFWQKHDFKSLTHIDKELSIYNKKTREYKTRRFNLDLSRYDRISKEYSFTKKLIADYRFRDFDIVYFIRLGQSYNKRAGVKVLNHIISIPEEFLNHYILIKLCITSKRVFLYQEIENKQLVEIKKSNIKLKI